MNSASGFSSFTRRIDRRAFNTQSYFSGIASSSGRLNRNVSLKSRFARLRSCAFPIAFFVAVGNDTRIIDVAIGTIILFMVAVQMWRMWRRRPPRPAQPSDAVVYGSAGGFTTFVSNSAGPVMNTYLVGLGLDKDEQVGTSAWFYFAVNEWEGAQTDLMIGVTYKLARLP